ncbi:unnamed protein product, partial [Mesorhabditis spiculigera]
MAQFRYFKKPQGYTFLTNFECTPRIFTTWLLLSTVAALIYALILFFTLMQKDIRDEEVPTVLPSINTPTGYSVFLTFPMQNTVSSQSFQGMVNISFTAEEATQRLFLHRGLNLDLISFELYSGGQKYPLKKGTYKKESEIQSFIPANNFTVHQNYFAVINFTGRLNAQIKEYNYAAGDGTRYGLVFMNPQTSSKGCRYLFPCFDSSEFPSNFTMSIRHHYSLTALSNFPSIGNKNIGLEYLEDTFLPLESLKPAQVALALTDYPATSSNDTFKITVYHNQQTVSTVSIPRIKQFMDESAYEIGKLDVVVVPDFTTSNQPGLSILNEKETIAESNALQFLKNVNGI